MRELCAGLRELGGPNIRFSTIFFIEWCAWTSCLTAQSKTLADTIWDGNAGITGPKLIWKQERPKFNRIETVSTVKVLMPIQLWFWGANDNPPNAMAVCFNQRKVGADPLVPSWPCFRGNYQHGRSRNLSKSIKEGRGRVTRFISTREIMDSII